ncbi:VOC family protein [Mycobacterium sp.]|uniref:VOC family protein n=1 Tax=Mycobacterium sp. TaxID=1785 RepID=UPI003C73B153
MPTPPHGAPIWIDLSSSDVDRAQEFYGTVFGWTFEPSGPDYGGYVNAFKDGKRVAGLMHNQPEWNAPDAWTIYFHTGDIQSTAAAIAPAGGSTCVEPMEVKEKGWMAMGTDPSGAAFGLWQPTGHRGFEVLGEPGAPVWHQLTTRDFAKAVDFYRALFGWQTRVESDTDEFRYTTAIFDGNDVLGVMDGSTFQPDGIPSHWTTFFGADDVDKTLQVLTDHGGAVLRPAEDTPYGRLAAAADPSGAVFNLSSLR